MKYLLFIVLIVVILSTGCISDNQKTIVTPTLTPRPSEPIIIPSTTQMNQNGVVNNGIIIYRNPEKIIKPEDLQIGDLIQRSIDDSLYEKNHGYIITNLSPQNDQYLVGEIVKGQIIDSYGIHTGFRLFDFGKWFGIQPQSSRLITFGALIRDYPYKFGYSSEPLPQIEYVE